MNTLPNLYSFRFFLAMAVVVFHIPITSCAIGLPYFNSLAIFSKGLVAVNFFFSLSGFLIVRKLYLEYKKNEIINIPAFFKRRMCRIWPVYFLVIILGMAMYHLFIPLLGIPYVTSYDLTALLAHYILFVPNVFNACHKVGGILNIMWSVGVEEQFYIAIPLLFVLFKKKIKLALAILLVVFLAFLFFWEGFYFFRSFFFYFLGGGILAILAEDGKLSFMRFRILHVVLLMVFVLHFCTNLFVFNNDFIGYHLFNLLLSNLFIVSIAYFPLFDLDRFFTKYFGQISYGIYMYHMIVVTLYLYAIRFFEVDKLIDGTLLIILNNVAIIGLVLFISHISYRYFESWFYKGKIVPEKKP